MHLSVLRAQGLRLFQDLEIELSPGFNLFIGENGAGKTSILEAADVLSRGKSFRAGQLSEVVRNGQDRLVISAEVLNGTDEKVQLGMARDAGSTRLRLNQQNVHNWSALTECLPILSIHPESYQLITAGPNERRKYVDWGLFHVEPNFKRAWVNYSRALKQRNFCLKLKHINEAKQWHQTLQENGEQIHHMRSQYIDEIAPIVQELADKLALNDVISLKHKPGWDLREGLETQLDAELSCPDCPISTQVGPHRADVIISWNDSRFAKTSSRGQQKILAIALKLAQAMHLYRRQNKSSIYLVDELPAELDQVRRQKVLQELSKMPNQVLITSISKDTLSAINRQDINWFHVERGRVTSMV